MFPYKIQSHQIIPTSLGQRVDFVNQILIIIENKGFDVDSTCFTDEAHFPLNGLMNKQNLRFQCFKNPHLYEEKPLHSPKVTARVKICTRNQSIKQSKNNKTLQSFLHAKKMITSEHYVTILGEFVSTQLALQDRQGIDWFMHDGA